MSKCTNCGESLKWVPEKEFKVVGRESGDVYSEAGRREIGITGTCEFCWDHVLFAEEEDEE
jgi:hypothetical protein